MQNLQCKRQKDAVAPPDAGQSCQRFDTIIGRGQRRGGVVGSSRVRHKQGAVERQETRVESRSGEPSSRVRHKQGAVERPESRAESRSGEPSSRVRHKQRRLWWSPVLVGYWGSVGPPGGLSREASPLPLAAGTGSLRSNLFFTRPAAATGKHVPSGSRRDKATYDAPRGTGPSRRRITKDRDLGGASALMLKRHYPVPLGPVF